MSIPIDNLSQIKLQRGSVSVVDILIFMVAGSILLQSLTLHRNTLGFSKILKDQRFYLVSAIWILGSTIVSSTLSLIPMSGVVAFVSRVESLLMFFLIVILVRDISKLRWLLIFWAIGLIISSLVAIAMGLELLPFVLGEHTGGQAVILGFKIPLKRSVGLFTNYGYYGSYAMPIIALAAMGVFHRHFLKLARIHYLVTFFIVFLAILTGQSRSTWLAITATVGLLAVFGVISQKKYRNLSYILALVAIIVIPMWLIYGNGIEITYQIAETIISIRQRTAFGRLAQFQFAWELFLKHPLFGIGPGSFVTLMGASALQDEHVLHNMFLKALVEHGIFGSIPLTVFFFGPLLSLVKLMGSYTQNDLTENLYHHISAALLAALIGIYVELFFSSGLDFLSLWLGLGLMQALVTMGKAKLAEKKPTLSSYRFPISIRSDLSQNHI